jgi:hypothetical protein
LQPYVSRVSDVCFMYFICMLHVFLSGCCKKIWCCICYNSFARCLKCMFHIYFRRMLQMYVPNVLAVSDALMSPFATVYFTCFLFHMFHLYVSCVSSRCCKNIWCCICCNSFARMF